MVRVLIPSYFQRETKNGHSYTVYCVEVYRNGRCFRVNKRYRDFYDFHAKIRKLYETPSFPPKKVRNLNHKIIEQRKEGLEKYIQGLIRNDFMPQELIDFLCLPLEVSSSLSSSLNNGRESATNNNNYSSNNHHLRNGILNHERDLRHQHQSLIAFTTDYRTSVSPCHSGSSSSSSLPDIVVKGTLDGFYSPDEDFYHKM